jgi:hypothetical protein
LRADKILMLAGLISAGIALSLCRSTGNAMPAKRIRSPHSSRPLAAASREVFPQAIGDCMAMLTDLLTIFQESGRCDRHSC